MKDVNPELEGDQPRWCSEHGRWECDEDHETNVERFDREEGLDQESAASWRKRWEAEQADKARKHNVASGMVQCSSCKTWFYDTPGSFCSFCS